MQSKYKGLLLVVAINAISTCVGRAQDEVTGVYQGYKTIRQNIRANDGSVIQIAVQQFAVKTDAGVMRYLVPPRISVKTPDGQNTKVRAGDYIQLHFGANGNVSEIRLLKLIGTVAMIDTHNVAIGKRFGQVVQQQETTRIGLKGKRTHWDLAGEYKISGPDGSPAALDSIHGGDEVELTFANPSPNVWEISEVRVLRMQKADVKLYKMDGFVSHVETTDTAVNVRRDRVPNSGRLRERALQSQDVSFITLKDKGRWQALPHVKIETANGQAADSVHVGDNVELSMRGNEIEGIKILSAAALNSLERQATTISGVVERIDTTTVPVEMRDGIVLKSKQVTKITLRDTGETWELATGARIKGANGKPDSVHADDEVELTLKGKLVTEVKMLKR